MRFFSSGPGLRGILIVAFVILATIVVSSIILLQRTRDYTDLVIRTQAIMNRIAVVNSMVRAAESGQRGYLLTFDTAYLTPYNASIARLPNAFSQLKDYLRDDPQRSQMLDQLQQMVQAKVDDMTSTVNAAQEGHRSKAMDIVNTDTGRALMAKIDQLAGDMLNSERQTLQDRSKAASSAGLWAVSLDVFAAMVLACVALFAVMTVSRFIAALHGAQRQLEISNENLETVVADRTVELREANEELQRYAYIVSHDLRAPLVNIMGFTSELEAVQGDIRERIARDGALTAEGFKTIDKDFTESIGFIKSSTAKMDRLISAILKLAREGRRRFVGERLNMNELVGNIVESVAHRAQEAGARIEVASLPPLTSDRTAVDQIFSNLIDNAIKYLEPGRLGRITVTGREIGHILIYEVSDNGRGIDAKDHQRIFELFRRSGSQNTAGEGIGLAHVRTAIRALGGTIACESELGKGATFRLTFPLKWTAPEEHSA